MEYNGLNEFNVAPHNAKKIGVYDDEGNRIGEIPIDKLNKERGDLLYRFGVLSDVHHDYSYDKEYYEGKQEGGPESAHDLNNALNFFEKDEDTEFTCICGDLTVQGGESASSAEICTKDLGFVDDINGDGTKKSHLSDLDAFKYNVNLISPTTPVFVARGNHDAGAINAAYETEINNRGVSEQKKLWGYYTNPDDAIINKYGIEYEDNEDNMSFHFIKELENGKKDVFIFIGIYGNLFWSGGNGYGTLFDDNGYVISLLEEHKTDRCFIFMHLMLDSNKGYSGNAQNKYNNMSGYYSGEECKKIEAITEKYPNTLWFTGHSHFMFREQEEDSICNISNYNTAVKKETGCYVHVPSCAYPRYTVTDGRKDANALSEGMVVDVYFDHVEIRGISFKTITDSNKMPNPRNKEETYEYGNKYIPLAHYSFYI